MTSRKRRSYLAWCETVRLKNIAWIYSCIITGISLMYTALEFYLWRGSISVLILKIMDKSWGEALLMEVYQSVSVLETKPVTDDEAVWWVMGHKQGPGPGSSPSSYRSRLWRRDKETNKLLRRMRSGDAMTGGQSRRWQVLVLLHIVTSCCWSSSALWRHNIGSDLHWLTSYNGPNISLAIIFNYQWFTFFSPSLSSRDTENSSKF